jgi:hypothetical protein
MERYRNQRTGERAQVREFRAKGDIKEILNRHHLTVNDELINFDSDSGEVIIKTFVQSTVRVNKLRADLRAVGLIVDGDSERETFSDTGMIQLLCYVNVGRPTEKPRRNWLRYLDLNLVILAILLFTAVAWFMLFSEGGGLGPKVPPQQAQ